MQNAIEVIFFLLNTRRSMAVSVEVTKRGLLAVT